MRDRNVIARRVVGMVVLLAALGLAALSPGLALAGVNAGVAVTFPNNTPVNNTVTVGEADVPASISQLNLNTAPNAGDTNTVCNPGDPSPPCASPEPGITLTPSCKQPTGGTCATADAEPGIFSLSSTGTGAAGSACAGMTFAITLVDPTFGTYLFTPQPAGAHVTLPGSGATCTINFTFDVLAEPTADADPATPGIQVAQATQNTQFDGGLSDFAGGTSDAVTVLPAPTSIVTTASASVPLGGGGLTDSATVNGRVNPVAGGTVTFKLYGPGDTTCSAAPVFTPAAVPYPVAGGSVSSPAYTPTAPGVYRWIAAYSGDANNAPSTGACTDANESTTVTPAVPTIATTASPAITLGAGTLSDSATVIGRVSPVAGATVTFTLYAPGDTTCSGTPVFTPAPVAYPVGGGSVSSPTFTPTQAGVYRWVVVYSGDANNSPVTEACNAADESTTVVPATPAIATTASPGVALGAGTLSDSATVTGRVSPVAGATVTFTLYAPGDTTCSGTPVFTPAAVPYPVAGGAVSSPAFTPTAPGVYRWVVVYSGDANNSSVTEACNGADESTTVTPAVPTIATTASPAITLGAGTLSDSATVIGRVSPVAGATITFTLYAPGDTTCSGTPVFTPAPVPYPVAGGSVSSPAFTPTLAGVYRWVAVYSGDANNLSVTEACNGASESTTVVPATPAIATTASPGITLGGGTLSDSATVSGRVSPVAGATITFTLYAPGDTTCSGTPVFTPAPVPYPVAGGSVSSPTFTPTAPGVYRWIAVYSGDANNSSVTGACNAVDESTTVVLGTPTIATTASPRMTLGAGTLSDSATVTGRVSPVAGATITFTLYAPGDTTCSATPVFTPAAVPYPVAGGSVSSPAYTPTAPGVYRWVAVYSGDTNNSPVTEACNAADESTTVVPGSPTIATTASPGITLGAGTLSDSATVSGRVSPVAGATITFTLYGPGNTTCTGAPVFGPAVVPYPVAGGSVSSPTYTPPVPGTYQWIAAYSGDADNSPVTGACTAATETATVTSPPAPTPAPQIAVTKAASPASRVAPGGTFTFTITVSDPSTTTPVTITSLVDNIYGNLATRSGSTCGKLIGVTLAPGATSQPCSFPGSFTGKAGASQTDVVTVTGSYNGGTPVTATAHATVTLSPAPTQAVLPVGVHEPSGCISKPVKVYVTGSRIARVVFYLDGKRLGTVSKRDSLGRFLVTISPEHLTKGKIHHLTVVTEPVLHSGQPVHTLHRDLDVCGTPRLPLFTG